MVNDLEVIFPKLRASDYRIESPKDPAYNCIAYAAGQAGCRWWPDPDGCDAWPSGVPREETMAAFAAAFQTLGYLPSTGEEPEPGFEKVALFADSQGVPTHAARQLDNGRWTSKLGELEDIIHDLHGLEGVIYGSVVIVMRRPRPAAPATP